MPDWAQLFDLPSKADVDHLGQLVAALGQQQADLARRVAQLETSTPPAPPPSVPPLPPPAPPAAWRPWQLFGGEIDASREQVPALTGSYYARWFWEDVHTGPRTLRRDVIEHWYAAAARRGLKLAWRINPLSPGSGGDTDHRGIPWMRDGGWPGFAFDWYESRGAAARRLWHFDLSSTRVRDELEWLVGALAALFRDLQARYGGGLEYVDMLGVGLWGEWHFNNGDGSTPAGVRVPSTADYRWTLDLVQAHFGEAPRLMTLKAPSFHRAAGEACAYACHDLGWGWRTDGWADPWHHAVYYPAAVRECRLEDHWRRAPVALEPAGVFQGWNANNWRLADEFARQHRATWYHNKGMAIPADRLPQLRKLLEDARAWVVPAPAAR